MEQNNQRNSPDTKNNNKHLIIAGIAIIVVIALAIAVPHLKKRTAATPVDTGVSAVSNAVTPTPAKPAATSPSSWDATLKQYSGKMITFAADCTATPITQALPKGTTVLLVNNSDVAHTVTVGTATYAVGARHYKTAYLSSTGTTIINCDSHNNVANIGVQQ